MIEIDPTSPKRVGVDWLLVLGLVAIGILIGIGIEFAFEGERGQVCHSTSEDSTPYDCEYEGDDNSWRRQ